jgi:flagellar M-ring protein FliF
MSEQQSQNPAGKKQGNFTVAELKAGSVVLLLVGFFAAGVAVLLWLTKSDYTELYTGIDYRDAAMVTGELQKANISYHFEPSSGTLMVRSEQYSIAKNLLAEKGLLNGFTSADIVTNSQLHANNAGSLLPHQALELELAKSIAGIDNVQSARVHLALANTSGNDTGQASRASVIVRLYSGRRLSETQISAISHLVAASVTNLSLDRITIIDQSGQMLKSAGTSHVTSLSSVQFRYLRSLEQSYIDRIEDVLTPVLGPNSFRAQVVADVEFKGPNQGAVENSPTAHVTSDGGAIRRLAATVLIDNKVIQGSDGNTIRVTRSDEEMQRVTELVKHAIGFNSQRGDSVTVINEPFNMISSQQAPMTVSVWEQIQYKNSLWYLAVGCIALIVIGLTMRLVRSGSTAVQVVPQSSPAALATGMQHENVDTAGQHDGTKVTEEASDPKRTFEQQLLRARQLVREDPKIVAQLVRSWMKEND